MSFLDALNPFNFDERLNAVPQQRILTSQAVIQLVTQQGNKINIGEIDSFHAVKNFKTIKRWKPYGSKREQVILEDDSWNISFVAGKVDWRLNYLVYLQEKILTGVDQSTLDGQPFFEGGSIYNKPLFSIKETKYYRDGSVEAYHYNDLVITNFEFDLVENNNLIPERITAFCPYREIGEDFNAVDLSGGNIIDSVKEIMAAINAENKN